MSRSHRRCHSTGDPIQEALESMQQAMRALMRGVEDVPSCAGAPPPPPLAKRRSHSFSDFSCSAPRALAAAPPAACSASSSFSNHSLTYSCQVSTPSFRSCPSSSALSNCGQSRPRTTPATCSPGGASAAAACAPRPRHYAAPCAGASLPTDSSPRRQPCTSRLDEASRCELGAQLLQATHAGRTTDVVKLLSAGADPNYCYGASWTPLHLATWKGYADIVLLLLESGVNVYARGVYGLTALHIAAYNDATGRVVTLLIDAGFDLNPRDECGRTPLHYAAAYGNTAAVRELVRHGANKAIRNHSGQTAFDVAVTGYIARFIRP